MNNQPDGKTILEALLELLADQEGVKIKYEITKRGKHNES